ncbi:MAG: hypothetical protein ABI467_20580 [Kofleriaceae bacterium]
MYAAPIAERVAVIDLGPADPDLDRALAAALVHAGLTPLDGPTAAALTGQATDSDAVELAAAMARAQQKFGALDCKGTIGAVKKALPLIAARQAGKLAVPELARAWAYALLCADRLGESDLAMRAASRLRVVGGSPDVSAELLAKYPEVDATLGIDAIEVDVATAVPGTTLWLDFVPIGLAPQHLALTPGDHVIAAASGTRRGYLVGRPLANQPKLLVEMPDLASPLAAVASAVASWQGKVPSPDALAEVLDQVHVRAALVRHGDVVEVWGHAGDHEPLRRLGGEDGTRTVADADRAAALLADRVEGWSSHAPDPDRPLLVEALSARASRLTQEGSATTSWWVYATIGAAVLAGSIAIYAHEQDNNTQEIRLHYP